jgi:hypothetical protein|tara:strand:- start:64 stop:354 length:291 start_codon:yes stop_codon:yes gene_type:complete
MTDTEDTTRKIKKVMKELTELLVLKNEQYGDSALNPVGIFANGSAEELIRVRMDDKISRLAMGHDAIEKDEDIFLDLAGYCVLWLVAKRNSEDLWD